MSEHEHSFFAFRLYPERARLDIAAYRTRSMDHLAAENSGHVSGTVKHSQYECTVVERLEDNQVISVCANPYCVAQVCTPRVVMRSVRNLLAVLPYFANE